MNGKIITKHRFSFPSIQLLRGCLRGQSLTNFGTPNEAFPTKGDGVENSDKNRKAQGCGPMLKGID